jgi:hypothetical protein
VPKPKLVRITPIPGLREAVVADTPPSEWVREAICEILDDVAQRLTPAQRRMYEAYKEYDTKAAAAKALGTSRAAVTYALEGNELKKKTGVFKKISEELLTTDEKEDLTLWLGLLKRYQMQETPEHQETSWAGLERLAHTFKQQE